MDTNRGIQFRIARAGLEDVETLVEHRRSMFFDMGHRDIAALERRLTEACAALNDDKRAVYRQQAGDAAAKAKQAALRPGLFRPLGRYVGRCCRHAFGHGRFAVGGRLGGEIGSAFVELDHAARGLRSQAIERRAGRLHILL